jgi:hypothetical protein
MGRSAQGFFWIWEWFRTRGLDFSSEPTEITLGELTTVSGQKESRIAPGGTEGTSSEGSPSNQGILSKVSPAASVRISLSDGKMKGSKGSVSAIKRKLEEHSIVLSLSGDILSIGLKGEPAPQFLIVNEYDVELADLLCDEESDEDDAIQLWMSSLAPAWTTVGFTPTTTTKGRRGRCLVVYVLNRNEADPMPVYRRWPLVHYHLLDKVEMPYGVRDFHEHRDGFKACVKRNVRLGRRRSI